MYGIFLNDNTFYVLRQHTVLICENHYVHFHAYSITIYAKELNNLKIGIIGIHNAIVVTDIRTVKSGIIHIWYVLSYD